VLNITIDFFIFKQKLKQKIIMALQVKIVK